MLEGWRYFSALWLRASAVNVSMHTSFWMPLILPALNSNLVVYCISTIWHVSLLLGADVPAQSLVHWNNISPKLTKTLMTRVDQKARRNALGCHSAWILTNMFKLPEAMENPIRKFHILMNNMKALQQISVSKVLLEDITYISISLCLHVN